LSTAVAVRWFPCASQASTTAPKRSSSSIDKSDRSQRLRPALRRLLEAAVAAGEVRVDVDADDLLGVVASLCMSAHNDGRGRAERIVALVDGLRYGAVNR
jgi:hypothetical protein